MLILRLTECTSTNATRYYCRIPPKLNFTTPLLHTCSSIDRKALHAAIQRKGRPLNVVHCSYKATGEGVTSDGGTGGGGGTGGPIKRHIKDDDDNEGRFWPWKAVLCMLVSVNRALEINSQ